MSLLPGMKVLDKTVPDANMHKAYFHRTSFKKKWLSCFTQDRKKKSTNIQN